MPAPPQTAPAITPSTDAVAAADTLESSVYTLPPGSLTGKFVFTSPGHGWQWNTTLNRYATDRGDNNEIIEDFGNQDQMTYYADYLLRAGATVIPMRPVGRQINEVVLDNDSPGVTFSGAWSNSSSTRYYDEDYGASADSIPYRFAATTAGAESATATYTPNIPQPGFYPVYTWVLRGTDRISQLYRVAHSGGSTEIRVDHSKVGSGWVYLGTYHFNAGSTAAAGSVTISNNGTAGKVIIADAIRFGNGMGDYVWTASGAPGVSGYPREDENSYHWIARSIGVGATVSGIVGSGNVSAPSNMAQYMFSGSFGEAVYVGIHSNASNGSGRGAVGLIDSDQATPNQANLALFLGRQINQDMQALNGTFEHNWSTRTGHTYASGFGEIDLGLSAEMDATIIETAFHDNVEDAALMRDPKARDQIARSMLQGTIEYFAAHGGLTNTTSLPTKPAALRALSNSSGQVTLNWTAGPSTPTAVYGAAPTGYRVYTSTNGYGFDLASTIPTNSTSVTLTNLDPSTPLYIRVTATNAGGESQPSEVMTALPFGGAKQVLVVNGFDRLDRAQNFRYAYAHTGDGLVDRVWSRYNNSFDYLATYGAAIHATRPGTSVASTSNDFVISGAVNLNDYDTVIWVLGNESTANRTFDATEQSKVAQFLADGGHLFVSGAEVAWDLDQQNNGRAFYENTLKGNYVGDDANTYTANVSPSGIFAGLASVGFYNGGTSTGANAWTNLTTQTYNVATPDVIAPQSGALSSLTYSTGSAAIQSTGTGGGGNVVLFGFPFETMTDPTRRTQVMARVLDFLSTSATPGAPILVAASDSGPSATDRYTNFDNSSPAKSLQFAVLNTIPGAAVALYANGTLIGSAIATDTATIITTNGTVALADGTYAITARQLEPNKGLSPDSASLPVTIDTLAPTLTSFPPVTPNPRSNPLPFQPLTFSESITGLTPAAFTLTHYAPTDLLTPAQSLTGSNDAYTLTNLTPVTANAGTYTLTLSPSTITDLAGNPLQSGASATWTNNTITATTATTISRNPSDPTALDVTTNATTYTFSLTPLTTLFLDGPSFTLTSDLNFRLSLNDNTHLTATTSQTLSHLAIRPTSTLDLLDNDILLNEPDGAALASATTRIREYLSTGQLFSSTALSTPQQNTTLGYAPLADLTGLPSTSLLIKYTYHGDTDLNGRVDYDDLARIDRGLLFNRTTWLHGDSNHDGIVDESDRTRAYAAFANQGSIL